MKFIKSILIFILVFLFTIKVQAFDFEVNSDKAIMINTTDNIVLFEKNPDEKASIASLTKIITTITVLDNIDDLNEEIVITYDMLSGLNGYSKAGFKVGNKATIEELLYALMLPSGADAAQALAIYTSGSIDEFVNLMNEEINKIGTINSHFSNPIGMDDENNYSTARDLAKILEYSLKNETFKTIFESNEFYIKALNKSVKKTLSTTANSNNIDTSIIKGAKTGWTNDAGMCLASTSTVDDIDYLLVVLNAKELSLDHIYDTINIYNYYKENYSHKTIVNKGDILYTLKVKDSKQKEYQITSTEDVTLFLENIVSKDNIDITFDGIEYIGRKTKKGDLLGTINISYNDNIIYSTKAYLDTNIKFYNYELYFSTGIITIIIIIIVIIKKHKKKPLK